MSDGDRRFWAIYAWLTAIAILLFAIDQRLREILEALRSIGRGT